MNLFTEKITEEERNWAIDQYPVLEGHISTGRWSYSRSALEKDFSGWKYISWAATNKFLYFLILIVCFSFSFFTLFIPMIIILIIQSMSIKKYENYKEIINKLKAGTLLNIQNENSIKPFEKNINNPSEDLAKLFELLKAGAITQEEYDVQKKKILN
jgi:hypothetical protein